MTKILRSLAMPLIFVALLFTFWIWNSHLREQKDSLKNTITEFETNLDRLEIANQQLSEVIETLIDLKEVENNNLSNLQAKLDSLSVKWYKVVQDLAVLDGDEDVKNFMDSLVPNPLAGLLNDAPNSIR